MRLDGVSGVSTIDKVQGDDYNTLKMSIFNESGEGGAICGCLEGVLVAVPDVRSVAAAFVGRKVKEVIMKGNVAEGHGRGLCFIRLVFLKQKAGVTPIGHTGEDTRGIVRGAKNVFGLTRQT